MPTRVAFLVDGFNVYHSLKQLQRMSAVQTRWLDLRKLCEAYLQAVRSTVGDRADIAQVHYFSALAKHLLPTHPDVVRKHQAYIAALKSTGVNIVLSNFKEKRMICPACGNRYKRHEEKETDVAIAVRLIESFADEECDAAAIISGDTDLIPAIGAARRIYPQRKIGVGFPFLRHNNALESVCDFSFKINQRDIVRVQFAADVQLADGTFVHRPPGW